MSVMLRRVAQLVLGGGLGGAAYFAGASSEYDAISEDELPKAYEPVRISAVWSSHPRVALHRLGSIAQVALPFGAKLLTEHIFHGDEPTDVAEARTAELAIEFRTLLVGLGPTFIKFGQMLSIRPDVLPPAAVYELQKLCDAVPSYPTEQALALIEAELGAAADALFDGLGPGTAPVAAASLGQVYRCRLESGDLYTDTLS